VTDRRPSRGKAWDRNTPRQGRSAYSYLYDTARWKAIRGRQLHAQPLCEFCLKVDLVVQARICDHVEPHKGDPEKFFAGPFQSLCAPCHDSTKQAMEKGGKPKARIGVDGYPIGTP
jgi:5-methylcytosine-specific restriction protein A